MMISSEDPLNGSARLTRAATGGMGHQAARDSRAQQGDKGGHPTQQRAPPACAGSLRKACRRRREGGGGNNQSTPTAR